MSAVAVDWSGLLDRRLHDGTPLVVSATRPETATDENSLPADVLADSLYSCVAAHDRGLTLSGVYIDGPLDLDHLTFEHPLRFTRCTFSAGLRATQARLGSITFEGCHFTGLPENEIEAVLLADSRFDGPLRFRTSQLLGQLDLSYAAISGVVVIDQTMIAGPKTSLFAPHLVTTGSMILKGEGTVLDGGVRLVGASIGGQLNLQGGVKIGENLDGYTVLGDGLSVASDMFVHDEGTVLDGGVRLVGASIGGQLNLQGGAKIGKDLDGYSLATHSLTVRAVFVGGEGTTFDGGIGLVGASIGGQLVLQGGVKIGKDLDGFSLAAHNITVGDVFLRGEGTTFDGGIGLVGGRIDGQLCLDDGVRIGKGLDGHSIVGDGVTIASHMFVEGGDTLLDGGVGLVGATIGGQLNLTEGVRIGVGADFSSVTLERAVVRAIILEGVFDAGISLVGASIRQFMAVGKTSVINTSAGRSALDFEGAQVPELRLEPFSITGAIDLTSAVVGRLIDSSSVWNANADQGRTWILDGFTVDRLSGMGCPTPAERIAWLASTGDAAATAAPRSTWRQVAAALERDGLDEPSINVLVEMRRRHDPRWLKWALAPIRQGYAPQRALYGLLAVFLVTCALVGYSARQGAFIAAQDTGQYAGGQLPDVVTSESCIHGRYPCMRPIVYALETAIPVLDLDSRKYWTVETSRNQPGWNDALAWAIALARIASWALGGLFLIGILRNIIEERLTE